MLRALRNIAIIAVLALAVAAVPGGGNVAEAAMTALVMAFLAAIAFAVHRLFRQNSFSYMSLSDGWRAAVVIAVAAIVLMLAGTDELLRTGLGLLVWVAVIGTAVFMLVRAWGEAKSY